jgi:hypothetical protein
MTTSEGATEQATVPRWRAWARAGVAVAILLGLGLAIARLLVVPSHGVRTVAACQHAYGVAQTHSDTVSVDRLSYPDTAIPGYRRSCGELRTATVDLMTGR